MTVALMTFSHQKPLQGERRPHKSDTFVAMLNKAALRRTRTFVVNGLMVICSFFFTVFVIEFFSGGLITFNYKQFHKQIVSYHKLLTTSMWPIGSYQYHKTIGFRLSPSFFGVVGNNAFFLKTHHWGYRVPKFADSESFKPGGILSLGCSFTFGAYVEADETFSYITAKHLDMPSYNYGVCSYSYASVITQLEDLCKKGILDKLKPSIVILGAGNWLIKRSLKPFYPTADLQFGYAYIGKKDHHFQVMQPNDFYSTKHLYKLADNYFAGSDNREVALNFGRYLRLIVISLRVSKAKLDQRNFKIKDVSSRELYDFVIGKITGILRKHNAKIFILWMPHAEDEIDAGLVASAREFKNVLLVDGLKELKKFNVARKYYYKRHPSIETHSVYAKALIDAIRLDKEITYL